MGAEVVEPNVLYGLNALCDGHVCNGNLSVSPKWEAWVGGKTIL